MIKCFLIEIVDDGPAYIRTDTGEIKQSISSFGIGAIWRATWFEDSPEWRGIDGKSYCVETPGGTWMIDGRANNCTMKDDNVHKCWCRHGEPPNFTVDKNGNTCSAGGGSILQKGNGGYHGFLRDGFLTET